MEVPSNRHSVWDLSAIIDPAISLVDHVNRLTRACFFHIRQLCSIRRSLTIHSCHALVRAMILSRLDYSNRLLSGALKYLLGPVSGGPPHASSSCFLGEATLLTRSPRDCAGSTFPHDSSSNSVYWLFGVSTGLYPLI